MNQPRTSLARIIATPIILLVTGYLIFGLYGLLGAGLLGTVYVLWAIRG